MLPLLLIFLSFSCAQFDPGLTSNPALICVSGFQFNPVCLAYFERVSFQPTFQNIPLSYALIRQFVHYLAPQWLLNSILPGTSAQQTFGLCQPFLNLQT
jgi:hypothetical protein